MIAIAQFFKTAFDTYCEDTVAHEIVNRILKTKLSSDVIDFYKEIINIDLHKTKINIDDDWYNFFYNYFDIICLLYLYV